MSVDHEVQHLDQQLDVVVQEVSREGGPAGTLE